MSINTRMFLVSSAIAAALAGCSDRLVEAPPLGGAIAQNNAAQIVDPKPESTDVAPALNGERNNGAMTRYETGKVIKLEELRTSTTSGSGGGSGSR